MHSTRNNKTLIIICIKKSAEQYQRIRYKISKRSALRRHDFENFTKLFYKKFSFSGIYHTVIPVKAFHTICVFAVVI